MNVRSSSTSERERSVERLGRMSTSLKSSLTSVSMCVAQATLEPPASATPAPSAVRLASRRKNIAAAA